MRHPKFQQDGKGLLRFNWKKIIYFLYMRKLGLADMAIIAVSPEGGYPFWPAPEAMCGAAVGRPE